MENLLLKVALMNLSDIILLIDSTSKISRHIKCLTNSIDGWMLCSFVKNTFSAKLKNSLSSTLKVAQTVSNLK